MKRTLYLFTLLALTMIIPGIRQAAAAPNMAAVYCLTMGYTYDVRTDKQGAQEGICRFPDGVEAGDWDFYKGKTAHKYSYCERYGFETIHDAAEYKSYTYSRAACVTRNPDGSIAQKISLTDFMNMHGDAMAAPAARMPRDVSDSPETCTVGPLTSLRGAPVSFDWRNNGGHSYIGEVRNQGDCGSCYSFGATAAAEGAYNITLDLYDGDTSDFSEAFMAFCLSQYYSGFGGCDGADYTYSELQSLIDYGTVNESVYPYNDYAQSCPSGMMNNPRIQFENWGRVGCNSIEAIKTAIMTYGVVDAAVLVEGNFESYDQGVYSDSNTSCNASPCSDATTNHAISLVGWGNDSVKGDYWILRNSWGPSWGENGYMRIAVTSARVACSVAYIEYGNSPLVVTGSVTNLASTGATLNGTVNPRGLSTSYYFQYGTTTSYGMTTTTTAAGSGSSAVTVSKAITGLQSERTYHYRLVASSSGGTTYGSDATFTTTGQPQLPSAVTLAAGNVKSSSATLNASVNPHNSTTTYYFEYGISVAYGHTTVAAALDPVNTAFAVSLRAADLMPQTLYHFRVVATNELGTVRGSDLNFTTTTAPILEEDFEGGVMPDDWQNSTASSQGWFITNDGSSQYFTVPDHTVYACANDDMANDDGSMDYLITPELSFSGYTDVYMTFYSYFTGDYNQTATVRVSTNGGSTWNAVATVASSNVWSERTVDLSAYDGVGSVMIAFHSNDAGDWASGWAVDDILVDGTPGAVVTVGAPVFNPPPGTVSAGQAVTITSSTAGAWIYYTTDGSNPNWGSTQYSTPVVIQQTTTLKAVAYTSTATSTITTGVYTVSVVCTCSGVSACCDGCSPINVGGACGDQSSTTCDRPNTCDAAGVCQSNYQPSTVVCRQAISDCDVTEYCNGSGGCPSNTIRPQGTACGSSRDTACDNPDTCDAQGHCLSNFESSATMCRTAASACDVAEYCDGAGACPVDVFAAAGVACGSQVDNMCNHADACDGSGVCLANFEPATTVCRAATSECDIAEYCNGTGGCPANGYKAAGTACGSNRDTVCDNPDTCNGNGVCSDNVESAGLLCRQSAGECDVAEYCDGAGACPSNAFAAEGTACGSQTSGVCDRPDACDAAGTCQENHASTDTLCREAAGLCDTAEYCNNVGQCPENSWVADGTLCDDGMECTQNDRCSNGLCMGSTADCDDDNECTIDGCSDIDGSCTHEPVPDWRTCGTDAESPMACFSGECETMAAGDDCTAVPSLVIGQDYSGSLSGYHRYRDPDGSCVGTIPEGPDVFHAVVVNPDTTYVVEAHSDSGSGIALALYLQCGSDTPCFAGAYGEGTAMVGDLLMHDAATLYIQVLGSAYEDTYTLKIAEQTVVDGDVDAEDVEGETDQVADGDTDAVDGDTEGVDADNDIVDIDEAEATDSADGDSIVDGDDDATDTVAETVDSDTIEHDAADTVDTAKPVVTDTSVGGCAAAGGWMMLAAMAILGLRRRKRR